jgi:hypothetical protein
MGYHPKPVANGLHTDHPIPDLPFVDDAYLPLDDPGALAAVGRHRGEGMWGGHDPCPNGGWIAFTTDPIRHELGWCVRSDPGYGRSVVLYRNEDTASAHSLWWGEPLLFRAGGYWWDGTGWFRPQQVWDRASETYVRRAVPAATTVTASDLLIGAAADGRARVLGIAEVDLDSPLPDRWLDHLAGWAAQRGEKSVLTGSVVTVSAPELAGDQLIGLAQMAEIANIAASTLRAYVARSEGQVPSPQAVVSGRAMWARTVAEEWAEQRWRSTDSAATVVSSTPNELALPPGVADVWQRLTRVFFAAMWERPNLRKRWALRWRTENAVRDLAQELGWLVAGDPDQIIPARDLATTIRRAVLNDIAEGVETANTLGNSPTEQNMYGISRQVARTLDWLIRHLPEAADAVVGDIAGEAARRFGIANDTVKFSLHVALALDGQLDDATYGKYLDRLFPEASVGTSHVHGPQAGDSDVCG